jgi:PAS domain S-box-containing protein
MGGFLTLALITLVVGLLGWTGLKQVEKARQELVTMELPSILGLTNLLEIQSNIQGCERVLLYEKDPGIVRQQLQVLAECWTNAEQAWQFIESHTHPPTESRPRQDLIPRWDDWKATHQQIVALLGQGTVASRHSAYDLSYGKGQLAFQSGRNLLEKHVATHAEAARKVIGPTAMAIRYSSVELLAGTVIGVVLSLVLAFLVGTSSQHAAKQRKAEKTFQTMVNNAPIGIFIAQGGKFQMVNPRFEEITGYRDSELVGKDALLAVAAADKERVRESAIRMLKGQTASPCEFQIVTKGGETKCIVEKVASIDYHGGKASLGYFMDISERQSLMESLVREKRFSEAALDSLPGIFYFFNDEQRFVRWNKNFEKVTGYSAQEFGSISPLDFFTGQDRDIIQGKIQDVFNQGEASAEANLVDKDGVSRRYFLTGKLITFDQERYVVGMGVDISKRYEAEMALRREKAFSDAVIDSLPGNFYLLNEQGRAVRWNRRHEESTGYSPEEIACMDTSNYFPAEETNLVTGALERVFSIGEVEFEAHLVHKNGSKTPYFLRGCRQTIDNETYLVGFAVDFTDRKQAEEALARNEELLRKVLGSLPVGVWITDRHGQIVMSNSAGQQIWGSTRDVGLSGFSDCKGCWADSGKPVKAEEWPIARAIGKGETSIEETIEIECLDGTRKIILYSAIPLRNDGLGISGAIIVNQDITARRKVEAEKIKLESLLSQAQKMEAIGTLAGGIAHDFNNILGIIIGYTEMLGLYLKRAGTYRNEIEEVMKAAQRAKDLVKQILTFSRQSPQEQHPLLLEPIVRETMKMLRSTIPTTIDIRTNTQSTGPVLGDPTQIQQVLLNLCANAAHAMRSNGGRLTVELMPMTLRHPLPHPELAEGPHVKLTVSDTGHGMSKEVQDRVFEPFFTTKGVGEGTGLGLSVVHGIVRSHKGAITIYSEPGVGTSFCVYLPLIGDQAPAEISFTSPPPHGSGCVLFVDDEAALADLGQQMLQHLGYEVVARTSSRDALEVFRAQPDRFDLIITDYTMPHLTGMQLVKSVKELRADLPIIVCTGFSEAIASETIKERGISDYLMKPLVLQDLAEAVHRLLQNQTTGAKSTTSTA